MKERALTVVILVAPLLVVGCSPCGDWKKADPNEPLRPPIKAIGKLPAGAVQCLDTHPSAVYDGSHIVYPKLDPNGGDAETTRTMEAQGWVKIPLLAKNQKAEFDRAVAGGFSPTKLLFRKPGTKNILTVESSHAAAWKKGNIMGAYPKDCAVMKNDDDCEGL